MSVAKKNGRVYLAAAAGLVAVVLLAGGAPAEARPPTLGYEVVARTDPLNPDGIRSTQITAVCPPPKVAVGGGYSSSVEVPVIADYPLSMESWNAIFPAGGYSQGATGTVFAVCVNP